MKKYFTTHKKLLKNTFILLISFMILGAGAGVLWVSTLKIPDLSAFEDRKVAQSTKIYDRTGQIILYDIHDDAKRTVLQSDEISQYIKSATIAIEDNEFYQHFGIKPTSIIRAMLADITSGSYTQGASTITQQVIKNSVLTQDKTITRKLKEWVLAIKLETVLTKDQILDTYLNETSYGGNIYGVEEASRAFFGKSAKDVTLAQAAYIAALPQAPSYYSPYGTHTDQLTQRKNLVLQRMLDNKLISRADFDTARQEKVTFIAKEDSSIKAPHFAMFVKDYLVDKYGEDSVEHDGLKVITTLDYSLQQKAESTIKNFAPDLEEKFGATNMGLVAIDPNSGDVLSMVGSRDYFDKKIQGNFNITTAHRQPGSSFKPIVYATAFNKGYTPETILFDVKTEFSTTCTVDGKPKTPDAVCYSPEDYDGLYEGPITIRAALAESRNIPAIKALYLVGIKDALQTASLLGVQNLTDPDRYGLTLVLGGGEVSLLDLTSAYSVFANDGVRNPYRIVLRVEDSKGNVLEQASTNPAQVLPVNTARQISDILSDPQARIGSIKDIIGSINHDIAVKTGTTNDYRDVWTLGYTPQLAVGMWAGNNDDTPINKSKTAGLVITPVWAAFMAEALKDLPNEPFNRPDPTPDDIKPTLRGIWQGGQSYFIDTASGNLATDQTPPEMRKEIVANSVHDILYWVNKDDPRGPIPAHPESDPQFASWEYAARNWFAGYSLTHPISETSTLIAPTTKDTVHAAGQGPIVSFSSPLNNAAFLRNDRVNAFISIVTPNAFPATKADYFINDKYVGTVSNGSLSFSFVPADIDNIKPSNTLKVVVYDSVLNKGEATVQFNVSQ